MTKDERSHRDETLPASGSRFDATHLLEVHSAPSVPPLQRSSKCDLLHFGRSRKPGTLTSTSIKHQGKRMVAFNSDYNTDHSGEDGGAAGVEQFTCKMLKAIS